MPHSCGMSAKYLRILPLCALVTTSQHATADPLLTRVIVRVYETASLSPDVKAAALALARTTLASTSADVWWRHCDARAQEVCDGPPVGEFVIRIVRSTTELPERHLTLGHTLVDTRSGAGLLATIYVDRVDRVAQGADMPAATLLGYAVAHELGHLLLASNVHNTVGLMRPVWRNDELRSRRAADWEFAEAEAAAIRKRLRSGVRLAHLGN